MSSACILKEFQGYVIEQSFASAVIPGRKSRKTRHLCFYDLCMYLNVEDDRKTRHYLANVIRLRNRIHSTVTTEIRHRIRLLLVLILITLCCVT